MKFLTKFGQVALTVTKAILGFMPMAQQFVPSGGVAATVVSDIDLIAQAICQVEIVGQALQLPGTAKLTGSAPLIAQIILKSSIVANHKIENAALFQQGCTSIASGMADVLNSLKDDVPTENKG